LLELLGRTVHYPDKIIMRKHINVKNKKGGFACLSTEVGKGEFLVEEIVDYHNGRL
jgi:hypothetical protein